MLYEALIILIVVFNLIDLVTTLWLIENGLAVEANPFMKEAMDMGVEIFIFVKLFFVLGGLYILRRNKDRKAAKVAIWSAFVTYFLLMIYFLLNSNFTI
tara:strand:- start:236 stop:532 length:297 start_codon:yes stop_codon:yes gene_type:complete